MITKNYLAAFDFDGVVWDTVNECFYVGYNVFKKIEGDIPADELILRDAFRSGRYLARTGGDFYIIFHLIKQNPDIDFLKIKNENFYKLREELSEKINIFLQDFYNFRKQLIEKDFSFWMSLQSSFEGVSDMLAVIKNKFMDLVICSTKDEQSIKKMLAYLKQDYIVFGKEYTTDKKEQIITITKKYGIKPSQVIFVDDLMENLLAVRETGAKVIMAGWGYNNSKERKKASDAGIIVANKENLIKMMELAVGNK